MIIYDKYEIIYDNKIKKYIEKSTNIKLISQKYLLSSNIDNILLKIKQDKRIMEFDKIHTNINEIIKEINDINLLNNESIKNLLFYRVDLYLIKYKNKFLYYLKTTKIDKENENSYYNFLKHNTNKLKTKLNEFIKIIKKNEEQFNSKNLNTTLIDQNLYKEHKKIIETSKEEDMKRIINDKLSNKIIKQKKIIFNYYNDLIFKKSKLQKLRNKVKKENTILENLKNDFNEKMKIINKELEKINTENSKNMKELGIYVNFNNYVLNIFEF